MQLAKQFFPQIFIAPFPSSIAILIIFLSFFDAINFLHGLFCHKQASEKIEDFGMQCNANWVIRKKYVDVNL